MLDLHPSCDEVDVMVFCTEYQQCSSPGDTLTGEWVLTDVADNTQLGSKEKLREKGILIAYQCCLVGGILIAIDHLCIGPCNHHNHTMYTCAMVHEV